jgi:hypothetical protein
MTEPPRQLGRPEVGFWRLRLVKGGPLVAACIRWCETDAEPDEPSNDMAGTRSPFLAAFINDQPVDMDRVWHYRGEPIDEATYRFMVADAAWAAVHAPADPAARPHERVNIRQLAIPF